MSLNLALKILDKEGFDNRVKRIAASADFIRNTLMSNGVKIFGDDNIYSNTVICFYSNDSDIIKKLETCGITISKGMGKNAYAQRKEQLFYRIYLTEVGCVETVCITL